MFRKKVSEKEIHCPANHRKAKLYECKSCTYKGICVVYLESQKRL